MAVLDEIAAERKRQIDKGYNDGHDNQHTGSSIARAAATYALHPFRFHILVSEGRGKERLLSLEDFWPWEWSQFRPGDRRENLIKAAALIVAEVERLDRQDDDASVRSFISGPDWRGGPRCADCPSRYLNGGCNNPSCPAG